MQRVFKTNKTEKRIERLTQLALTMHDTSSKLCLIEAKRTGEEGTKTLITFVFVIKTTSVVIRKIVFIIDKAR